MFYKFEHTDFIGMLISMSQGHPEVNNKMTAIGYLEFLTFCIITYLSSRPTSYLTNLRTLISFVWLFFTIHGHLEVKTKIAVVKHCDFLTREIII